MTQQSVTSVAEALNLLRQGALSRTTGATQMNSQSSRSHAIFTLLVTQQKLVQIEVIVVPFRMPTSLNEQRVVKSKF